MAYAKGYGEKKKTEVRGKLKLSSIDKRVVKKYELRVGMITPFTNLLIVK